MRARPPAHNLGQRGREIILMWFGFHGDLFDDYLRRGTRRDHAAVVGFCSASFGGAKKTGRAGAEC